MLVRLFGKNFRSLKDEFELSMVAADLKRAQDSRRGVIEVPINGMNKPLGLLRAVAIYGANASGKSTVLTAGHALRWLATHSSPQSKPDARIPPYEPFLLDKRTRSAPVELGCDVVYQTSLLRYFVRFEAKAILQEKLTILDENREVNLIDRLPSGEIRGDLITNSDVNRLYVTEMQPNVTVLSKLAQHGPHKGKESAQPYYRAIRNATRFEDYSDAAQTQLILGGTRDERFAKDRGYREWIMNHLIRAADVGICDVQTRREVLKVPEYIRAQVANMDNDFKIPDERFVVSFIHAGDEKHPIDFSDESSGTKKLFNIADDWWRLANESVTLFADELSSSVHPRLLDRLIRAVNQLSEGIVQSQLVFTTHETGLLESQDGQPPALRRDQVYFTKKSSNGATELYSLAEFKDDARHVHNIRKRYISGLYGAIPSAEKVSL